MYKAFRNVKAINLFCQEKEKHSVTFADLSQAYDLVPRQNLFRILKSLYFGVMLAALIVTYCITHSVLGTTVIGICLYLICKWYY